MRRNKQLVKVFPQRFHVNGYPWHKHKSQNQTLNKQYQLKVRTVSFSIFLANKLWPKNNHCAKDNYRLRTFQTEILNLPTHFPHKSPSNFSQSFYFGSVYMSYFPNQLLLRLWLPLLFCYWLQGIYIGIELKHDVSRNNQ